MPQHPDGSHGLKKPSRAKIGKIKRRPILRAKTTKTLMQRLKERKKTNKSK